MMENDPDNADIPHMDLLADKFGLHFNNVLVHHVIDDNFAMGRIDLSVASRALHASARAVYEGHVLADAVRGRGSAAARTRATC